MSNDSDFQYDFGGDAQDVSSYDLESWGVGFWAYATPATVKGQQVMAIFGADGEQLGLASDLQSAFAAIRQHDMEPVQVH